ncbi:MAG: hypothetical protein GXN93_00915 [Candidatus Diapherotrites archaeon]|nr:hypothetical protein [Candidatus Diapherotrites archaeon]
MHKRDHGYIFAAIIGFLLGVIVVLVSKGITITPKYSHAMILLDDPHCDVCAPEFNTVANYIDKNIAEGRISVIRLNVYSGAGAKIYAQLREKNVNLVPLILFTKDLANTQFFTELNKALASRGGLRANLIDLGNYYALRPMWPTRRYVPGEPTVEVNIFVDKNYDVNALKQLLYLSADNVVVHTQKTNDVVVRIDAPHEVITAIAPYFPLARVAYTEIVQPKISATVFSDSILAKPISERLKWADINFQIHQNNNQYVLASIVTPYPDLVGKIFPGARYYPSGIAITPSETISIDAYFAGSDDENFLKELNAIQATLGRRAIIVPHFAARSNGTTVIFPGGKEAFDRAALTYCAYLQAPQRWTTFALAVDECNSVSKTCVDTAARRADVNADAIIACANQNAQKILQAFVQETARTRITKTMAIIDGWLTSGPKDVVTYVCALVTNPPNNLCKGVNA